MEYKEIEINEKEYILKFEESYKGIYCSIYNNIENRFISRGSVDIVDNFPPIFTIDTPQEKYRKQGFATYIMRLLIRWAINNKHNVLCGNLTSEDKEKGNWEFSIPFYSNLQNNILEIKETYFLRSLPVGYGSFQCLKTDGALSIDEIKLSNSGFIVYIFW